MSGIANGNPGDISRPVEQFLAFLRDAANLNRMAEQDEKEADALTQDLLHWLELSKGRSNEKTRVVRLLKDARTKRRVAKNVRIASAPVVEWERTHAAVIKELERLLGDVRKAERYARDCYYRPRTAEGCALFSDAGKEGEQDASKRGEGNQRGADPHDVRTGS